MRYDFNFIILSKISRDVRMPYADNSIYLPIYVHIIKIQA